MQSRPHIVFGTVHPRAYGEHWGIALCNFPSCGSSPCIRGTPLMSPIIAVPNRFIPVHTGNTTLARLTSRPQTVHPRAYGEHGVNLALYAGVGGSSPCIRGTPGPLPPVASAPRFIPVHTGNTAASAPASVVRSVHPRAYGEHSASAASRSASSGSSPCIRGTRDQRSQRRSVFRFIPVHTGNTLPTASLSHPLSVHPRAYGEHHGGRWRTMDNSGSSPCIRGTRILTLKDGESWRFIPVHTGNTGGRMPLLRSAAVHPRAYGEHNQQNQAPCPQYGSSPCIRGTPGIITVSNIVKRFIPVHTGNTSTMAARTG